MKAHSRYPAGTVRNGDLLAGSSKKLNPGQKCIDVGVDSADLPFQGGLICFHQDTVRSMCHKLGWTVLSPGEERNVLEDKARIAQLEDELAELRELLDRIRSAVPQEV